MYYPLRADVYYSTTTQNKFGELVREWYLDKIISCRVASSTNYKDQNVFPEQRMHVSDQINVQTPEDVRVDSLGEVHSLTDILISAIRIPCGQQLYIETVGERKGMPSLYEVAAFSPHVDPFNTLDYIKLVLNRSDEQVVT